MDETPRVVRLVGDVVDYADGAESELLEITTRATDVSSRSDELAESIRDWPTRYHLSRLRSNLLRPFRWEPGVRVLDVGAGTGTMARFLGEQGANVVALEGNPKRAMVAAERCRDLESVEVLAGDVGSFEPGKSFDVVLVVGVLEYTGAASNDDTAALAFLDRCRSFLAPGGVLILAIENQLGLKYLLGHPEDHLGEPGSGLEGYAGGSVARTFTRKGLTELLAKAGFPHQQWLYPFPDYKIPTVVLRSSAYLLDDAAETIDRLVPAPVQIHDAPVNILADARGSHRVFLEAGLGPDVANSFLVVAGTEVASPGKWIDATAVAWLMGDDRRSQWLRDRVIRCSASGDTIDSVPRKATESWLTQHVESSVPFVRGPSLEQLVLAAFKSGDEKQVDEVLARWSEFLSAEFVVPESDQATHPFAARPGDGPALPGTFLDVNLDNFVVEHSGGVVFVDTEWESSTPVDSGLVQYRALWYLASHLIMSAVPHGWAPESTVGEATADLAARCGLPVSSDLVERWRVDEASFQSLVQGQDESSVLEAISARHILARADVPGLDGLPFTALRRDLRLLMTRVHELEISVSEVAAEAAHRQDVIDGLAAEAAHRQGVIDGLAAEAAHRQDVIDGLAAEAAHRLDVITEVVEERDKAIASADAWEAKLATLKLRIEKNPLARILLRKVHPPS